MWIADGPGSRTVDVTERDQWRATVTNATCADLTGATPGSQPRWCDRHPRHADQWERRRAGGDGRDAEATDRRGRARSHQQHQLRLRKSHRDVFVPVKLTAHIARRLRGGPLVRGQTLPPQAKGGEQIVLFRSPICGTLADVPTRSSRRFCFRALKSSSICQRSL